MNERGIQLPIVLTLIFSFLFVSSVTLAAPVGQAGSEPTIDASDIPIDTDVTRDEALEIAERVLGSSVTFGVPRLHTEEDDQVMWIINYETRGGEQKEIVINTVTGAYRLVLDDGEIDTTTDGATLKVSNDKNQATEIKTATTVRESLVSTTTEMSLESRIIALLQEIIALLRTQASQ